jgi:hypothetical protein
MDRPPSDRAIRDIRLNQTCSEKAIMAGSHCQALAEYRYLLAVQGIIYPAGSPCLAWPDPHNAQR